MRRCGAKGRSGPCRSWPVRGRARCRMHGGTNPGTPKGERRALKHGAYVADPDFTIDGADAAIQARIEAAELTDPARLIRRQMLGAERIERAFVAGQIGVETYIDGMTRFGREARSGMEMLRSAKDAASLDKGGVTIDFGYFPPAVEPEKPEGSADADNPAPDAPQGEPV